MVQETLRHLSVQLTLDTYSHLLPNMGLNERAAARLDALLTAPAPPPVEPVEKNSGQNDQEVVSQLEPDRCVAETAGGAPRRSVTLILRRFRFRQTQEYENGAVERLHFFGGQ